MATYVSSPLPAQAAAGADVNAVVAVVEPADGQGSGVDHVRVTPPAGFATVTGVATNNVTISLRQVRGGQPVGALPAPTGLTATAVASGGSFAAATYFWKVTGTNAQGETVASAEASVAIALNGSATLAWNAVSGATGYRVYRATAAGGESTSPAFVAAVTTNGYTDTGTAVSAGSTPVMNTTSLVASLTLGAGTSLVAETPVTLPVSGQVFVQQDDVLDAVLHQNGAGLAVGAGLIVQVGIN